MPEEVRWSAGKRFPMVTVRREDDDKFCAVFNYWGPMLVQGQLKFSNGETTFVHVYARMPEAYEDLSAKR